MEQDEIGRLREENTRLWSEIAELKEQLGAKQERLGLLERSIDTMVSGGIDFLTAWRDGLISGADEGAVQLE